MNTQPTIGPRTGFRKSETKSGAVVEVHYRQIGNQVWKFGRATYPNGNVDLLAYVPGSKAGNTAKLLEFLADK